MKGGSQDKDQSVFDASVITSIKPLFDYFESVYYPVYTFLEKGHDKNVSLQVLLKLLRVELQAFTKLKLNKIY